MTKTRREEKINYSNSKHIKITAAYIRCIRLIV